MIIVHPQKRRSERQTEEALPASCIRPFDPVIFCPTKDHHNRSLRHYDRLALPLNLFMALF
jgi:hypothetical protein